MNNGIHNQEEGKIDSDHFEEKRRRYLPVVIGNLPQSCPSKKECAEPIFFNSYCAIFHNGNRNEIIDEDHYVPKALKNNTQRSARACTSCKGYSFDDIDKNTALESQVSSKTGRTKTQIERELESSIRLQQFIETLDDTEIVILELFFDGYEWNEIYRKLLTMEPELKPAAFRKRVSRIYKKYKEFLPSDEVEEISRQYKRHDLLETKRSKENI